MIGQTWPSEKRTYIDPKSGYPVTQLTNQGINYHFYFTDNSFTPDNKEIYFLSNRADMTKDDVQLYRMNLESGIITQLTDDPETISTGQITKTRDSKLIAYFSGKDLHLYHTETGENQIIFTDEKMNPGLLFFNCDNTKIGFSRNEDVSVVKDGPNYAGFKDRFYAIKDGRISVINVDGTGFHDVYCDTHYITHFQYSPDDPAIAMYCHEGPWNLVMQRIWIINMETGEKWPCFRQGEDDCVGHEFWSESGDIIFDNRRGGHDGTISNTKEQVYAVEKKTTGTPYFGFAHKDGKVYKKVDMPFYCNHYFGNKDLTLFVGDAIEDLVLIKPDENGKAKLKVLANHNTTWHYQRSHCHPTFSWDNTKVLYSADTDDWHDNIFMVDVPEFED